MRLFALIRHIIVISFCLIATVYSYAAPINAHHKTLINYFYLGKFTKDNAKMALKIIPPLDKLDINYSLDLYRLTYQTPAPDGSMATASGLVAMPRSHDKKVGIVSFQHGTRVSRTDVPSYNNEKNYVYLATFGSSGGYMTVMPDYLGMGDSNLTLHPYVQAETLASSSIDMLLAAKELAKILNYAINEELYLAGYSEGGFSTLVMFEELLNNNKDIPVTAAAPGSAPYDWQETMRFIMLKPGPRGTVYLALFFYSMQTYKHYWEGLDKIFVKPYDTLIPVLFDGNHLLPEILQSLPLEPREIFHQAFYDSIYNGTDKHSDELKQNFNHYSFKPGAPLLLVGSKGDLDLPYHGAEIAYQAFKEKSDTVFIKHVSEVLDHVQAAPFVIKEQLDFFKQYASIHP